MAIWVTGDIHGGIDMHKLSRKELKRRGITLSDGDFLIILGDFGFPFLDSDYETPRGEYHYWMKWFRERRYTVLWIDGNHENFNFWDKQPITERFGGKVQVHPEAPNVLRLMRGEVYEVEGKTFFAFGGATSHDKGYRTPNVNWWEQEEASSEEMRDAKNNLKSHGFKVDYILTHTPPRSIINALSGLRGIKDKTADFLEAVLAVTDYKLWLCGHIHREIFIRQVRLMSLYQSVFDIEELMETVEYKE